MKYPIVGLVTIVLSGLFCAETSGAEVYSTSQQLESSLAVTEGYQVMMLKQQREADFGAFVQTELEPFWETHAKPGQFVNKQGLVLHFVEVSLEGAKIP